MFAYKVFNEGSTLIILKTKLGAICGGFTSKSWTPGGLFTADITAFVFNMTHKFIPCNFENAIYLTSSGFEFGNGILAVKGDYLNADARGNCWVGKNNLYNIEPD